ncbi:MAG: hypothetical protein PHD32_02250 [Eubacteriales bacterium]|nr:hypothetical protein [Eubacteriales bacterium]
MKKSIYSLVLSDPVVAEVDRMAYSMETSRSNLVNQILAQYVSYVTPEMRMKDIFNRMERIIDTASLQVQAQPSDTMLSFRTALHYRYNPTVRYSVELNRTPTPTLGVLKIQFRTQSARLLEELEAFFTLWAALEQHCCGRAVSCTAEDGRFTRAFALARPDGTPEQVAQSLCDYIQTFDTAIKLYLASDTHDAPLIHQIEKGYRAFLNTDPAVL